MSHRRSAVCGREDPLVRDAHTLAMHVQQAFERPYGDVDPSAKNVGTDNAAKTDNTNATTSVAGGSTTANTSSKADLSELVQGVYFDRLGFQPFSLCCQHSLELLPFPCVVGWMRSCADM